MCSASFKCCCCCCTWELCWVDRCKRLVSFRSILRQSDLKKFDPRVATTQLNRVFYPYLPCELSCATGMRNTRFRGFGNLDSYRILWGETLTNRGDKI